MAKQVCWKGESAVSWALHDQLAWMLQHPTERQNMGLAARQRVEKQFASALMAKRYVELYNRLLGTSE